MLEYEDVVPGPDLCPDTYNEGLFIGFGDRDKDLISSEERWGEGGVVTGPLWFSFNF